MTRGELRSLVTVIDHCIDEFCDLTSPWEKREVVLTMLDQHAGVVGESNYQLVWEGLWKLISDRMRRRAIRENAVQSDQLPLRLEGIDPPQIVSLPPKIKGGAPRWIAFRKASPANLLEYRSVLDTGIRRDQRASDDIGAILAAVEECFDHDCDQVPMDELFRRMREMEAGERSETCPQQEREEADEPQPAAV